MADDIILDEAVEETVNEEVAELTTPTATNATSSSPKESDKEKNMRIMRETNERIARERDEAQALARKYEQMMQQQQQSPQQEQEYNVDSDALVEGKHLKSRDKKVAKMQEEIEALKNQVVQSTTRARIMSAYPDFDKVVTTANLEALATEDPETAASLKQSTADLYTQAAAFYKAIKKNGISMQEDEFANDRAAALKNVAKPRPMASISPQQGDSPLSRANAFANGLTDDLKAQLHKEMIESMKNR